MGNKRRKYILIILLVMTVLLCILYVCRCNYKNHRVYHIKTDSGYTLDIEIDLRGNIDGLCPIYYINCNALEGHVSYPDRRTNSIPPKPLSSFKEIGHYGDTDFYSFQKQTIFINGGKYLSCFYVDYDVQMYEDSMSIYDERMKYEYIDAINSAIRDILLTEDINYIYQFGPIIAQKGIADIKPMLSRYTTGDFSEKELESFKDSSHTKEEIKQWAAEMLAVYYD